MEYTLEYFQKSVDYLKKIVPYTPEIAIVLGSALGPFADTIEDKIVVDYKDSAPDVVHGNLLLKGQGAIGLSSSQWKENREFYMGRLYSI